MNSGLVVLPACSNVTGVEIPDGGANADVSMEAQSSAVRDSRAICIFIVIGVGEMKVGVDANRN